MSPDATPEEKAVYEEVKRIGRNLQKQLGQVNQLISEHGIKLPETGT